MGSLLFYKEFSSIRGAFSEIRSPGLQCRQVMAGLLGRGVIRGVRFGLQAGASRIAEGPRVEFRQLRVLSNLSIRNKLAGIILLITLLALGVGFTLVSFNSIRLLEEHLVATLDVIARAAGDYSAFGLAFEDVEEASLAKLADFDNVIEAHLFDTDKQLFVSYARQGEPSPPSEIFDEKGEVRDGNVHIFAPVNWHGKHYGTIYVRGSTESLDELKHKHWAYMGTVMLGLVLASVVFAYLLQGPISKPLLHLAEKAQEVSDRADYSIRVEKPGQDEIGILYDGFNEMLEQIQIRQQELERSNRDLDQFAYVASHDLKAPLRAISTLSRWLEEDLGEDLPAESQEQMRLLRDRVQRMDALVDGILKYSRVGRIETRGEVVDVGQLLAETVELIDPPAGFEVVIAPDMPTLTAKRLPLSQVFSNLIDNAIKYHDRCTGRVEVTVDRLGDVYEFAVADDGPGIPPQYHGRIFLMFQTLQSRDEVESTGLGLSLVKKLVEEEGGKITVESTEGRGATFRFTWPLSRPMDPVAMA